MNPKFIRITAVLVLIAALFAVPFAIDDTWVGIVTRWIPLAIGALGLNLLTGYNGQVSAGQGALYGTGAYATALVVNYYQGNFLLGILAGGGAAFLVGVLIGLPALRIRGLALALATLAFAVVFGSILGMFDSITNAPNTLRITYDVPNPRNPGTMIERLVQFRSPIEPDYVNDVQWRYLYALIVALVCFVLVRNLMHSRVGRAIIAIRDNEIAAATSGINVNGVKLMTFAVSSMLGGIGGGLFALTQDQPQLNPNSFLVPLSLSFLVMVVLGGPGTIIGPAVGAGIYGFFNDILKVRWLPEEYQALSPLLLAVLMIISINISPGGAIGTIRDAFDTWSLKRATRVASESAN